MMVEVNGAMSQAPGMDGVVGSVIMTPEFA